MSRQQEPPRGRSSGHPDAWVAPTVALGQTGLTVSRLGFGCSQINSLSSRHSHGEICDTILEAVDRGINLFDTADVYGQGDSERLLGRLLAGRGDEIVLCTKVGQTVGPAQHLVRLAKPLVRPILRRREARRQRVVQARRRAERKCFAPEYLVARIVASLRRLRRDCADVVLLHSPPPEVIADGGALQALVDARSRGMVAFVGVSVDSAEAMRAALERPEVQIVQAPYNRLTATQIAPLLALAEERGVAVILREPFAGGRVLLAKASGTLDEAAPDTSTPLGEVLEVTGELPVVLGMTSRAHLGQNLNTLHEWYESRVTRSASASGR